MLQTVSSQPTKRIVLIGRFLLMMLLKQNFWFVQC